MAEYIERETALQKVKKLQETDPAVIGKKQFADGYFAGLDELEVILRGIPAVELAQCEYCTNRGDPVYCPMWINRGLCSYGERRDDG